MFEPEHKGNPIVSEHGDLLRHRFSNSKSSHLSDYDDDALRFNEEVLSDLLKGSRSDEHGRDVELSNTRKHLNNHRDGSKDEGMGSTSSSFSTQQSEEAKMRRRSYKESGYGGSSEKSEDNASMADDVFDSPVVRYLSRGVSLQPDLETLEETSCSLSSTMDSTMCTKGLESHKSESSDVSSSGTFGEDDVKFIRVPLERGSNSVPLSPTYLDMSYSESLPLFHSVNAKNDPMRVENYVPSSYKLRLPSLELNSNVRSEQEVQRLYLRILSLQKNNDMLRMLASEERPEVVDSFIQKCISLVETGSESSIHRHDTHGHGFYRIIPSTISEGSSIDSAQANTEIRWLDDFRKLHSMDESTILSQLRKYGSCWSKSCQEPDCVMGRFLTNHMERHLDGDLDERTHYDLILKAITNHAGCCDELKCPIPWCNFFAENDLSYEEQVARLRQYYFSGSIKIMSESTEFDWLDPLNTKGCIGHIEGVEWHGIARLGRHSNTILAVTTNLDQPSFITIKKERNESLWHKEVLGMLKPHPRIVRHHWLLEQEYSTFIASNFEGVSLADRVGESGPCLSQPQVLQYLDQLASAVIFLHKSSIAYLYWTTENIILSCDTKLVKLCNFSCAVPMINELHEDKIEDLKMMLPPRIVPPELYQMDTITKESDLWGLGCIAYHMLTGEMIYPELKHEDPAIIRDKFSEDSHASNPDLTPLGTTVLKSIIGKCLLMDPTSRPEVNELRMHIIKTKKDGEK